MSSPDTAADSSITSAIIPWNGAAAAAEPPPPPKNAEGHGPGGNGCGSALPLAAQATLLPFRKTETAPAALTVRP